MKSIFSSLWIAVILLCLTTTVQAQIQDPEAKAILDQVSSKYRSLKSFKAKFKRTIKSNSGEEYGSQSGTILVSGIKFQMEVDELKIYCDGKTVWTWMQDVNEVNVTNYEKDGEEVTPTTIYDIYKKDYKYVLYGSREINGKMAHVMDLEPTDNSSEITKIRLWVEKESNEIVQWTVFQRGSNDRQVFEILEFTPNMDVKSEMFVFEKSKHPSVTVVDLR